MWVAGAAAVRERSMQETTAKDPRAFAWALFAAGCLALGACTPTVRLEASDKPITINLNVKIDQEIRVRLDKELEDAIARNPDLF